MRTPALLTALALAACSPQSSAKKPLQTEDQKLFYTLGFTIGDRVASFALTPDDLVYVQQGLADSVNGVKSEVDVKTYGPKLGDLQRKRAEVKAQDAKKKGAEFAEAAAKESGAEKLPSGLVYRELTPGTGEQPTPDDTVEVNYRGTLIDGTEFDSSYKRGQPAKFQLRGVIPCWTEGVARMKVGAKAKLICPSTIAYGDGGRPSIPGGSTLVFEVELMSVQKGTAK